MIKVLIEIVGAGGEYRVTSNGPVEVFMQEPFFSEKVYPPRHLEVVSTEEMERYITEIQRRVKLRHWKEHISGY